MKRKVAAKSGASIGRRTKSKDLESRAERVYMTLSTMIREGGISPGQRMREIEIGNRFGVSRTPVREALRRLESEGLLTSASRRGLVVRTLDLAEVVEVYALREVLEGFAAFLAAQHASEAEVSLLRSIVVREARLKDPAALELLSRQLHQSICVAARNRYLLDALNALRDSLALLPNTTFSAPGRRAGALREHTKIVDAIERHAPSAAEDAARAHIRIAGGVRQSIVSSSLNRR